jgi:hypothetical protein
MKSNPPIAYSEVWKMRYGHGKTQGAEVGMNEPNEEVCGKCGTGIDLNRRVDFTLKDGTRVCESCFVKGTEKVAQKKSDWSN